MTFSGTTQTDYMKLVSVPDTRKQELINYAGTDFLTIRQDLINYIKAVYPLDYNNFSESDLGMMLVELVAYMGASFSLKSDMLANENFIRTVKTRRNLEKLLELVGVSMRGPLAAAAGASLVTDATMTAANFPLTIQGGSRVVSIPAKEDGALVNYTLYKVANNTIQGLNDVAASLTLEGNESSTPDTSASFTNLALIEGALTTQSGRFTADEGNKTVVLTNSPIIDGSVQVYVQAGVDNPATGSYKQVERIYSASGVSDKVFQMIYDDDYAATLVFGDNVMGIAPPPNSTFFVAYRVGGGTRGNMRVEMLNTTVNAAPADDPTSNISFVLENTTAATGGSNAETAEHAKKYAPLTFKRQDRVVTLEDFMAIANSFISAQGTVGKSTAAVRDAYSSANVIDLYVLEKSSDITLQKASPAFKQSLLNEIEPKKMLTDEVVVCDGLVRTLDLVMTVRIDSELKPLESQIRQEVVNEILDYFNVDNLDFEKPFIVADLNRRIFQLPNVRYATVDNLPEVTSVEFNEIIQLNNFTINMVTV
jgi:hypothetical protein